MMPGAERWSHRLSPGWLLRAFLAARGTIQTPLLSAQWRADLAVIRETRRKVPLLLNDAAALQIMLCAASASHLDGAMAEAGVFRGGSARLICEKKKDRPLHLFDVFEAFQNDAPPSSAEEASVRAHFGKVHGARSGVESLLAPYSHVHMHPGLFSASAAGLEEPRFSFVHLDLDLPDAMHDALAFFHPRMQRGGIILGDDINDPAVRAVFECFFAPFGDTLILLPWGQAMIVRQGD